MAIRASRSFCRPSCGSLNAATPPQRPAASLPAEADSYIKAEMKRRSISDLAVAVARDGRIVALQAYGFADLELNVPVMLDTIVPIASLDKQLTASGIMLLVQDGKVRLDDPVTTYLPEFQGGESPITVRNLMTHFSGLRPDLDLEPAWSGYETGIRKALSDKPAGPPETKFVYSDINFELAGEIVRRVSGLPENEYLKQILFDPLGMKDTGFYLPGEKANRLVAVQKPENGKWVRFNRGGEWCRGAWWTAFRPCFRSPERSAPSIGSRSV